MGKSYEGVCQLCGDWGLLTDDHIPQKSLYPKNIRFSLEKMNSVKACFKCNNESNQADEFLKVIVGNLAHSFWDGELWRSTISTLYKNQKIDRLLEKHSTYMNQEDHNGEIQPTRTLILENELKHNFLLAMERIAKGLFYQKYGEVLVENREISIFHPEGLHPDKTDEINRNLAKSKWQEVNNGTCRYVFIEMDTTDIVFIVELFSSIKLYYVIQLKRKEE